MPSEMKEVKRCDLKNINVFANITSDDTKIILNERKRETNRAAY